MRKFKGWGVLLMSLFALFTAVSCAQEEGVSPAKTNDAEGEGKAELTYVQISQEEAKRIMDTEESFIIIDARTEEEFAQGHIEGAILIPEYEIASRAEKELPDQDALILVYCRSGRRSKIASEELVKLGYTNVKEFGGIIDWPYETVK